MILVLCFVDVEKMSVIEAPASIVNERIQTEHAPVEQTVLFVTSSSSSAAGKSTSVSATWLK
jgi:hypothetical protein